MNKIGNKIGDFEIIENITKHTVKLKCTICGKEKISRIWDIIKTGNKHNSCSKIKPKHGDKGHGIRSDRRFYSIWKAMRTRTTNPNIKQWKDYGGRGINSNDYIDYDNFYNDLYKSYVEHVQLHGIKNTSLDRIDANKHYTKDNCKWSTKKEQNINQRNVKIYIVKNKKTSEEIIIKTAKAVGDFLLIKTRYETDKAIKEKTYKGYAINKV